MSKDGLGDRMKSYESNFQTRLLPMLPIMIRIDGKGFSKWTKGFKRPYDERLSSLMERVTEYLVKETNAVLGYTQSDEISLILYSNNYKTQVFFDGRLQKLSSVLASMTTAYFNENRMPNTTPAMFDCRVWQVPTLEEAANTILWREKDATKNSISMAARELFSHSELQGKSGPEMQRMMLIKNVNWNDYPPFFKRGVFIRRSVLTSKLSIEELDSLPEKHEARKNPDLEFTRSFVGRINMPPFGRVLNRVGVIFGGEDPIVGEL